MTDLEVCINAIAECGRDPAEIEKCLDTLRPIIEPYFEEGGFDKRFATSFRSFMRMPLKGSKLQAKKIVEDLLSGPTYAEQQAKIQAEREAQEAAARELIEQAETAAISQLLTRLGLRKGDVIPVHRGDGVHLISLERWDLPEVEDETVES